ARSGGVPAPPDTAAIVVTSGTTGEAKGVELTGTGMEVMGRGYAAGLEADAHDRWLTCLPLHHVASLGALARAYGTGAAWGAPVMRGYRLDPRRSTEVLDPDGWLHTGDIGELDDRGRLRVVDRAKDLVISGGVNVSPTEVENVLTAHPGVEDVCVIGVPDDE